jgi:predicted DNA-binding transcriptional regulator AlpA
METSFGSLLVDAGQGAKMLGVSVSHFYKFTRKNPLAQPVTVGTLNMWRRNDLLRFSGKHRSGRLFPEDVLVDARKVAELCSVSRGMVYKLNVLGMMPEPILDGRTLRWSIQEIEEWVNAGCPERGEKNQRKGK